ncbi:hypothetical protein [Streptomyces platensis]|uniref:hypothetical protein n=1 Tax=Streptomyces platensis TaxID=58346 RepID=UPI0027E3FEA9|nr:hypothetical protein [Streptomyces platensis]MCF3144453.1 hypothetical protein [Streptomyces platensis]
MFAAVAEGARRVALGAAAVDETGDRERVGPGEVVSGGVTVVLAQPGAQRGGDQQPGRLDGLGTAGRRLDAVLGVRRLDLRGREVDGLGEVAVALVVVEGDQRPARRVGEPGLRGGEFGEVGGEAFGPGPSGDVGGGAAPGGRQRQLLGAPELVVGERVPSPAALPLLGGLLHDAGWRRLLVASRGGRGGPAPGGRAAGGTGVGRQGDRDHGGRAGQRDGGARDGFAQVAVHQMAHGSPPAVTSS